MKLAVIGTAGRKDDAPKMSKQLYDAMYDKLVLVIGHIKQYGPEPVTGLVSGGAAWADHLAVTHFMKAKNASFRAIYGLEKTTLKLHLPCRFVIVKNEFEDNGNRDFRTNPGEILNHYHSKMPFNSLEQIATAMDTDGCTTVCGDGLKGRNSRIAEEADAVVAFTFGNGRTLKPGGTEHTMQEYFLRKLFNHRFQRFITYHVDLNTMIAWPNAEIPRKAA